MLGERESSQLAQTNDAPATPSAAKPPYQKPPPARRGKKPGRKKGHPGSRRAAPREVHHRRMHRATKCPRCGSPLNQCAETRTRYTEDIPENLQAEVTEHTIHRDWCSCCRMKVEPAVTDALPGATLGNRTLVLTAWLHYSLGNTLSQVTDVFGYHLQLPLTSAGLLHMWHRLAEVLYPWYEAIGQKARQSAVLHGDETGWRVNGKTHWLWSFANHTLTYYLIHRRRSSVVPLEFFREEFAGTLVTDFWGAYNAVSCALRQKCLVHLLRDMKHVEKYKSPRGDWAAFAKKLRRLIGDAVRLWRRREELSEETYASRRQRIAARLQQLIDHAWESRQAKRLIKRLRRHQNELFTFLDQDNVPFENNLAERAIRPAVIIRKNSYGNRSERGADTQAVLMTIFRTLKQNNLDPTKTITNAIATYLQTSQLPPLAFKAAADG